MTIMKMLLTVYLKIMIIIKEINMTKHDIIKKYIYEYDYYGLLEMGCPDDEFDTENDMICKRVSTNYSVERIARIITDVFNEMFLENDKPELFMETAQKIKNAFIENNITD